MPIQLFWGTEDFLVPAENFERLLEVLPDSDTLTPEERRQELNGEVRNRIVMEKRVIDDYNHMDYMWAKDAHI